MRTSTSILEDLTGLETARRGRFARRTGQAVTMELRLTHATGFDGLVRPALEQEVFDRLDFQNWYPNPSAEIGEGSHVVYEFDPPQGNTLGISLAARVAPTQ